jgi:hypothetical protein
MVNHGPRWHDVALVCVSAVLASLPLPMRERRRREGGAAANGYLGATRLAGNANGAAANGYLGSRLTRASQRAVR